LLQLQPPTTRRIDDVLSEEEHDSEELAARTLLFAVEQENADLVKLLGLKGVETLDESLNQITDKVSVLELQDPDIDENEPSEDEALRGELDDDDDNGSISVEVVRVEAAVSATGPVDLLDADSRRELCARLSRSNDVLRLVIPLVNSSGIVTEADHYNTRYFRCDLIDPDMQSS
jgi:hypothetical protein